MLGRQAMRSEVVAQEVEEIGPVSAVTVVPTHLARRQPSECLLRLFELAAIELAAEVVGALNAGIPFQAGLLFCGPGLI
jgi:hypothetical protein